jgi:hypothetical protein
MQIYDSICRRFCHCSAACLPGLCHQINGPENQWGQTRSIWDDVTLNKDSEVVDDAIVTKVTDTTGNMTHAAATITVPRD